MGELTGGSLLPLQVPHAASPASKTPAQSPMAIANKLSWRYSITAGRANTCTALRKLRLLLLTISKHHEKITLAPGPPTRVTPELITARSKDFSMLICIHTHKDMDAGD